MQKRGHSILTMNFHGIFFRDVTKMLAPGFSLAGLCRMTNLPDIGKSIFPFELCDSLSYLDEPTLPKDPAKWYSRLSNKAPSQAAVDEALEKFKKYGFKNVGAYLIYYLKSDCQILRRAVLLLFNSFFDHTGSHPIDCQKMTIGSLASHAAQMFLHREKRIGFFSPNQPALYSILKKSTLGGLTEMTRSTCLQNEQSAKINSHILGECPDSCEADSHINPGPSSAKRAKMDVSASNISKDCCVNELASEDQLLSSTFSRAAHASVYYDFTAGRCLCQEKDENLCKHTPGEFQSKHGQNCRYYDISSLYAASG